MKINFDVPKTWQVKKLEELSHAQKGSIKIGPFGSLLKKAEYSDSGIRVLGIDHVLPNQLTWEKPKYIPEKKYKELAQYSVYPGDILVTNMGTVGRVCVVPDDFPVAIISSHLIKVTPDIKQIDPSYFSWVLNFCPLVVAQIRAKCHGAIMAGFNTTLLKSLEIPLPPIAEQKRIAAILDKADAVRRKRREAIRLTEELLRSTFLEMFGDPVTNSKKWEIIPLGNLAEIQSGVAKGKKINPDIAIEVDYMRVANIQDGYIDLSEIKKISIEKKDLTRYLLKKGDVLLTEGGDPDKLGRGSVWDGCIDPCIHQNHIFCVRPNSDALLSEFLSSLIGSERGKRYFLRAAKQTTGIATINKTQLKNFPVMLPPLDLQRKYSDFVQKMKQIKIHRDGQFRDFDELFNSLLQRAFTGDL